METAAASNLRACMFRPYLAKHLRCQLARQSPTAPVRALQPRFAAHALDNAAAKLYAAAGLSDSRLRNPSPARAATGWEVLANSSCTGPQVSGAVSVEIAGDRTANIEQAAAGAAFPVRRAIVVAEADLGAGALRQQKRENNSAAKAK